MSSRPTIVILAGEGTSTNILYHTLKSEFDVACVILEQPPSTMSVMKRRAKKIGYGTVVGQVMFGAVIVPFLKRRAIRRTRQIYGETHMDPSEIDQQVITRVESVNSPASQHLLASLNPAVVVVNGTRIIAPAVFAAVNAVFLNTHAGITPLYRGVHGGYWALANGAPEDCGVTVHLVDPGIDTGGILYQARIDPVPEDSYATYPLLQLAAGIPLLKQAIHDVLEGRVTVVQPPQGASRLWSHPTALGYLKARLQAGVK